MIYTTYLWWCGEWFIDGFPCFTHIIIAISVETGWWNTGFRRVKPRFLKKSRIFHGGNLKKTRKNGGIPSGHPWRLDVLGVASSWLPGSQSWEAQRTRHGHFMTECHAKHGAFLYLYHTLAHLLGVNVATYSRHHGQSARYPAKNDEFLAG